MAARPELKDKSTGINMAVAMLILVISGLACVAGLQHLLEKRALSLSNAQGAQWVEEKGPAWHLRLEDFPEEKIFIGFKYDDRIYMDASDLCRQPGFRRHIDSESEQQFDAGWIFEARDIELSSDLTEKNWWVISSDMQPEDRVFDTAYQWLRHEDAPPARACLFLGQKEDEKIPQELRPDESEPVIGLMGFAAPLDLYLQAHEGVIAVTAKNRLQSLHKFPWLLAWLHQFSSTDAKQCGSSGGFMPTTLLLPMKVKILPNGQQSMHWLAATGCEPLDRWSLVMANEDETTSFITLNEPMGFSEYGPAKVWTTDIDGDGIPEFLIKARYYKGSRYVLLRLNESEGGGYHLAEIATSAYEGL